MKEKNLVYIALALAIGSCSEDVKDKEVKSVVVEIDNPVELYFSDVIDTCYFVPLDSKVIIGEISSLDIGVDYFAVLDRSSTKSIYLFDWQGNLKTRINDYGEGPGKFRIPIYINLFEKDKKLVFYDDAGPKILTYNFQGELLQEKLVGNLGQFNDFKSAENGFVVFARSGTFDGGDALMYVDKDIENPLFPLENIKLAGWEEDHRAQNSLYKSLSGENFYFQINTTSDLLEFNKTGLVSHIRFDFSSRGLDYSNSSINPYDLLHISRAQDLVFLGPNNIDLGDYMLLDLLDSGLGKMAIFDKKNGHARMVSRLVNDLSLMMNFSGIPGAYNNQPGYLTLAMPYGQFESIRSKLDFQDNPYREVIEKISSDDPESLVLMIYKFKTDFEIDVD